MTTRLRCRADVEAAGGHDLDHLGRRRWPRAGACPAERTGDRTPRAASRADSRASAMTDRQTLAVQSSEDPGHGDH